MTRSIFVLLLLAPVVASAVQSGNCSKKEVLDLAKSGYSKNEIFELCNSTLDSTKCCCHETHSIIGVNGQRMTMSEDFVWKEADECDTYSYGIGPKVQAYCVQSYRCGR